MGAPEGQILALQAFTRGWKPKSRLTVSEWADANRVLSSVGSSEPGAWKTSRTPYSREIMVRAAFWKCHESAGVKVLFLRHFLAFFF